MQLLFEYQELWIVVSEGIVGPVDAATTRKDLKARFFINQSLDPTMQRQLELLQMKKTEKVADYFSWTLALVNQMKSNVKLGNNSKVLVMGKGKISISLKDGSKNTISNVLFVLSLHQNLLSIGQLSEKGYDMRIYKRVCTINDEQKGLIAKVNMSPNRLFPMHIKSDTLPCFSFVIGDGSWLWHMRFGHVNFRSLKLLSSRKMVSELPVIDPPDRVCEACVMGKKHKDPFPTKKTCRVSRSLELMHSDLCSVETLSNGGYRYFITFIDDFRRKAWVYFLQ
ncbi:hypothetical protein EZV62_016971 [Acer yangbiense]|uniref:Uncharacterized protein n=1 Tax=Acer yangbiense TaxID=1000413 RepID=A0A5C7HSJ1_9ROSI|nr:hypothetical protein EZV62_016971 [Acer yangbiense]